MNQPIYLDYAATTPVQPVVAERMADYLTADGTFANPASRSHLYGWFAEEAVEQARGQVAQLIGADPREIVWTSGATEADNLALKGVARALRHRGRHIVTCTTEHKAVVDPCHWLEDEGFEVTWLPPEADGSLPPERLRSALREDTLLVSLMHANSETGVIHDIDTMGAVCREAGVLFHVDAAQTVGKLSIDLSVLPVDLMSLSAHKIYGPKGVGALYVRRAPGVRVEPQIHGGGHERGVRSGTLATHQVVGMGEALALAGERMEDDYRHLQTLRDRLREKLSGLDGIHIHGEGAPRLPGHLNMAFSGVNGEMLLTALNRVAVSSGSACTSATLEPSYVLRAMGVPDELAHSSVRFSVGRFTALEDIEAAGDHVCDVVQRLRAVPA
jgi:cysteine desulfurase